LRDGQRRHRVPVESTIHPQDEGSSMSSEARSLGQALKHGIRREWMLLASFSTCLIFAAWGVPLFARMTSPGWLVLVFAWLFAAVLGSALSVVRHADFLAERFGQPLGTLLLTLSVTSIEVMSISAVMLHGANNPTLARDTMFSVVMIVLNGMVGLSLLVGGWRHHEQHYNLLGANAYIGLILPLAVLSMVLPNFTRAVPGPLFSFHQEDFLIVVSVGLYAAFLAMQTRSHRSYFAFAEVGSRAVIASRRRDGESTWAHGILLLAYMLPVVFLAEQLARPIDYVIETLHEPAALGGLAMAVLVATPEAIGAVRAAAANDLQRSVNIFLGSVLSTICLTVPAMLLISHFTGHNLTLGLQHADQVMLVLTLAVSVVTFASGRTNALQGAVHFFLFLAYILLITEN
jgi:Ca2+:H+ antiporter